MFNSGLSSVFKCSMEMVLMKKINIQCRQVLPCLLLIGAAVLANNVLAENILSKNGESIYKQICIACHGADGTGVFPGIPDLTDKVGRLAKTDKELITNMKNGYQSPGSSMAMPAKGGNSALTDDDLSRVLKYLRDAFGA
jgi:mono/diheme cytochrome c family protein